MTERGYLEGSEMAGTFNLLRANDLIWSFVVNNYLLGKDPFPFDLLYWNSDSTRMPAKMHTFYLRNMYIKNLLTKPGGITLAGEPIDVSSIKTPSCFVSTHRRSHRAVEEHLHGSEAAGRPVKFVAGRLRAHRRRGEPAVGEQVLPLDQRRPGRDRRRVAGERAASRRFLVAGVGCVGQRVRRRQGGGALAGRWRSSRRSRTLQDPT